MWMMHLYFNQKSDYDMMKASQVDISKQYIFLSEKINFVFANNADPDEMPYSEAYNLGLHRCKNTCSGVSSLHRVN